MSPIISQFEQCWHLFFNVCLPLLTERWYSYFMLCHKLHYSPWLMLSNTFLIRVLMRQLDTFSVTQSQKNE